MQTRPKIGLALGAGAFRGIAHIGVLQVFAEQGVPIDMISGCSVGSIVGGAYCAGQSPYALEKICGELNDHEFYDFVPPREGLLRGAKLQKLVERLTAGMNIEDMPLPFACVACDMNSGDSITFREGPAHEAIRGSISVPGVFVPHEYAGFRLIDGGCMNALPVDVVREMGADIVIAVDISDRSAPAAHSGIIETLLRAFDLAQWQQTRQSISKADITVFPSLEGVSTVNSSTAALALSNGRKAAQEAVPRIREAIERFSAPSMA